MCDPIVPMVDYTAQAPTDCNSGGPQRMQGSWTLTLKSVEAYGDAGDCAPVGSCYIAHGTMTATLLPQRTDGGSTATLSLSF